MSTDPSKSQFDVVVVGAGASGLMCAIHAGRRGLKVLVLEKGPKPGLKILVSGGGRCNFTNLWADPQDHYLSANEHFCISAMRRYSSQDFIDMVDAHGIAYHEKKLGQLFCNNSAQDILDMLLAEASAASVEIRLRSAVTDVSRAKAGYQLKVAVDGSLDETLGSMINAPRVVLASGGLSMPKISSDLAYRTAQSLDMVLIQRSPALVPLTWNNADRSLLSGLSGVALDSTVTCHGQTFRENLLFTHRGLSGPAILQISSFWQAGEKVDIDLLPELDVNAWLSEQQHQRGKAKLSTVLKTVLPNRFVDSVITHWFAEKPLAELTAAEREQIASQLKQWEFKPGGTEGYRTAEVTLGGISTTEFSSKTFEAHRYPGLYAVGEALDVTGWLGGYNFQWAWASGYCCAQHL